MAKALRADKPNILVIMADQHAPQFSRPYGHPVVKTPSMDRLAAEGVTFENAYTSCPICVPARMSFMTGRYVSNIGIWDNGVPLREDAVTWAHCLRNSGYQVVLSGKMHFRGHDHLHGFEEQLAFDINAFNRPEPPDWSRPLPAAQKVRRDMPRGPGSNAQIDADNRTAQAAIEFICDNSRREKRWALCVGFVAPHVPFVSPPEFYEMYDGLEVDIPIIPEGHLEAQHPFHRRLRAARGLEISDEVLRDVRRSYYGLTSFVDAWIGRMLTTLEQTQQLENTVVIYTADHGEMLGEHGLWQKCTFYEHSVRIPLIIRWPVRYPQGRRIRELVSLVDLTATLVELGKATTASEEMPPLDGLSLDSLIVDSTTKWPDEVFCEFYGSFSSSPMAMLRKGHHKLHYYLDEEPELFDLEENRAELRNLAEERPDLRAELEQALLARWKPESIDRAVRRSQAERRCIEPYLFTYLNNKA